MSTVITKVTIALVLIGLLLMTDVAFAQEGRRLGGGHRKLIDFGSAFNNAFGKIGNLLPTTPTTEFLRNRVWPVMPKQGKEDNVKN